jgi:mycofactocin precursor
MTDILVTEAPQAPAELSPQVPAVGVSLAAVTAQDTGTADEVLADDLLVEEVSIDGMCGVY